MSIALGEKIATSLVPALDAVTGLDLELELRGEGVYSDFNGDLRGIDRASGRKAVLIVQEGESDNKHLLRLLHNAADKEAKVLIWIVTGINRMHPATIAWLQANTVDDISVHFLLYDAEAEAFIPITPKNWRRLNG